MVTVEQLLSVNQTLFIANQTMMYTLGFLLVLIVLVTLKTPGITFLKAFLTGKPLMAIKRKDGKYDFQIGRYSEGIVWHKYGFHQIDPEAITREKKSGADIHLALDSIGITLSPKLLQYFRAVAERYGWNTYDQIIDGVNLWRLCKNKDCNYEGKVDIVVSETQKKDKEGNLIVDDNDNPILERTTEYKCPECGNNDFRRIFPEVQFETGRVFSPGFIDNYFKYNMNPRTNEVVTKAEVQNELDAERKTQPMKWIAIGTMILLIMMGFMILYIVISKDPGVITNTAANLGNTAGNVANPDLVG